MATRRRTRRVRAVEPLSVQIDKGKLIIEIGVETLAKCAEHSEDLCFWDNEGDYQCPTVTDASAFADAVVEALEVEDEIGGTPLHYTLDKAMLHAAEWGAAGIVMPEMERKPDGHS